MKAFLAAALAVIALGRLGAAEQDQQPQQETTHLAGRENKTPGAPGYQQVNDGDTNSIARKSTPTVRSGSSWRR